MIRLEKVHFVALRNRWICVTEIPVKRMKSFSILTTCCGLFGMMNATARPWINEKPAPQNSADLMAIQEALQQTLPKTRAATIAIEYGGGSGSGVIISADGLVLTAAHVITGVDLEMQVIMEDGTKHDAVSLGLVASSDAAMLKILGDGPFPFVDLDRNEETKLGDWVYSLGHSGGFSEDRGAVVRLGRVVRIANSTFQTDCRLIGGDSGGPLFDLEGRLVAIHSRVGQRLPENMHVPMHEFLKHWDAMERAEFVGEGPFAQKPEKGSGFLGVIGETVDDGFKIVEVVEDSPASKAGIEVGDVIIKLNHEPVPDRETLRAQIAEMWNGHRIELELRRTSGDQETLHLRLGER